MGSKRDPKEVYWEIDVGPYPYTVFYAKDKTGFDLLTEQLKIKGVDYPPEIGGMCTYISHEGPGGQGFSIITFNPPQGADESVVVGIIAHEASHAVDFLFERIGEEFPGAEQRAYTVQAVTQSIYSLWKEGK